LEEELNKDMTIENGLCNALIISTTVKGKVIPVRAWIGG
jgi:hypothetical protein